MSLKNFVTLGRSGLRVSPLCLGAMTFGEDWGWGTAKDESRKIYEAFRSAGGNFIDTANLYTNGTSETFLGEFMQGHRDSVVLATKYTNANPGTDPNAAGNQRKSMFQAIEASSPTNRPIPGPGRAGLVEPLRPIDYSHSRCAQTDAASGQPCQPRTQAHSGAGQASR